jgi:hypothetical protein
LTIVSIGKGWNCCHCQKGADFIPRIGLGSQELGVPHLVPPIRSQKSAGQESTYRRKTRTSVRWHVVTMKNRWW